MVWVSLHHSKSKRCPRTSDPLPSRCQESNPMPWVATAWIQKRTLRSGRIQVHPTSENHLEHLVVAISGDLIAQRRDQETGLRKHEWRDLPLKRLWSYALFLTTVALYKSKKKKNGNRNQKNLRHLGVGFLNFTPPMLHCQKPSEPRWPGLITPSTRTILGFTEMGFDLDPCALLSWAYRELLRIFGSPVIV